MMIVTEQYLRILHIRYIKKQRNKISPNIQAYKKYSS